MDISIVIGFKDWGSERLLGAVRSLMSSTSGLEAEIIVSDYGSRELLESREEIEALGATYIYTETNGIWSRSRALNAGLRIATGKILATTDADMVFSPGTFQIIVDRLTADPTQYFLMQCRDLPPSVNHDDLLSGKITDDKLESLSVLRPRWGMGGLIAVPASAVTFTRGLDERMEIYGGEDIDFAKRMRRLGLRQTWLDEPEARMYHVWHPSSRVAADATPEGKRAIAINRQIHMNDKTVARNVANWEFRPEDPEPLVSIVISTYNRAEFLADCILSIQAQTFADWELILINDGSSDNTKDVVASFKDDRIRYYEQPNSGLASARNRGTKLARGRYVAVHDDDDIMLPTRLEVSLDAVKEGFNGSTGGWIDYVHETGERIFNIGKKPSLESLLFNTSVYLHPTLFIEKKFLEMVPYDDQMRSGSDYNLGLRLQRAGAKIVHSGEYLIMRRLHEGQITNLDSPIQKSSGAISSFYARSTMLWSDIKVIRTDRASKDKPNIRAQKVVEPTILKYLPDHVVRRDARISLDSTSVVSAEARNVLSRASGHEVRDISGRTFFADFILYDMSLHELFVMQRDTSLQIEIQVTPRNGDKWVLEGQDSDIISSDESALKSMRQSIYEKFLSNNSSKFALVLNHGQEGEDETTTRLQSLKLGPISCFEIFNNGLLTSKLYIVPISNREVIDLWSSENWNQLIDLSSDICFIGRSEI